MPLFESYEILRIAAFSAFIGFFVFCLSYAFQVWRKRNTGLQTPASRIGRIGATAIIAGILGVGGLWAMDRMTERAGIVDGNDLFVVHAKRDSAISLSPQRNVARGDVIAEFRPPEIDAQITVFDSQIAEAYARLQAMSVRPVAIDPILLQQQAQIRAQLDQQRQFRFELIRAKRDIQNDLSRLESNRARDLNQIENEFAATTAVLSVIPARLEIARSQFNRVEELRRREVTSAQLVDDRTLSVLALEAEALKLEAARAGQQKRLTLIDEQGKRDIAFSVGQLSAISRDLCRAVTN